MSRFVYQLLRSALTLVLASVAIFAVARLSGNPVNVMLPLDASPQQRTELIQEFGLDQPIFVQYVAYVRNAVTGHFGNSLLSGTPVSDLVRERLGNSLILTTAAILLTVVVSTPLGVMAAARPGSSWDRAATFVAVVGQAVPSFLSGIVAILVFSLFLKWLPSGGIGDWQHFVMPVFTIALVSSAGVVRLLRSSMLEVLGADYVRLARAKGLAERNVIRIHALRNALLPVITYLGFTYGFLLATNVATEVVFNFPGLGRLIYDAAVARDFPLLQLAALAWAVWIVLLNVTVDSLYLAIDPRIRS